MEYERFGGFGCRRWIRMGDLQGFGGWDGDLVVWNLVVGDLVVGLDGIGFEEVVVGEKGLELGVGGFGEGNVPGIEGSAPGGRFYLLDFKDIDAGVGNVD